MVTWVKSTEIYTNPDNSFFPLAVFYNSYNNPVQYPNVPAGLVMDQWCVVDLKPHGVEADAKWAMLAGILIITGAAELTIACRAPGSVQIPSGDYYDEQLLSVLPYGGERSVGFNMVPLVNGCFEIYVRGRPYPLSDPPLGQGQGTVPCVGLNLKVEAWGR